MINNSSTLSSWGNNFNNGDEALFNDASLPRDSYGFKIQPGMQSDKLDFGNQVKGFYLDQITAVGGKELTGIDGDLKSTIIPLGFGDKGYKDLNFSDYGINFNDVKEIKGETYTKGNLNWRINDKGGIIIPASGSYGINFYSEVYFDPDIGQTVFWVALLNTDEKVYYRDSEITATNPDNAGSTILQDLKQGDVLYLGGAHSSASGKKALYIGTVTIFKLS